MNQRASHMLLVGILIAVPCGAILGLANPEAGRSIQFLGQWFLNALLVVALPLVMSSIILGVSSLGDIRRLGGLAGRTLVYFMGTTAVAVLIGLTLVSILQPGIVETGGDRAAPMVQQSEAAPTNPPDRPQTIGQLIREVLVSLLPHNLVTAIVNAQVLPIIIFSLALGAVLTMIGEPGRRVIRLVERVNGGIMTAVHVLLWAAPIGVGALVAGRLGEAGGWSGFWPELVGLGWYAGTVILALLIHGVIVLPLLLQFVARRPVMPYARNMATALTTAFSTSSSSATIPMTLQGVTERNGVSQRMTRFVVPLGATINMNGTALYEAIAAVFIAQRYGIELELGHVVIVFLTATLAAIGAAGIPEAGLVTMVIVLKAVDLPLEGISLILVIDWFLDRCRTTVNVWGDAVGAAVVERLEGDSAKGNRRTDEGEAER
ncbi:MAG: dicarboxylate/amino acid:cation symporter [Nitrospirales bacterium]